MATPSSQPLLHPPSSNSSSTTNRTSPSSQIKSEGAETKLFQALRDTCLKGFPVNGKLDVIDHKSPGFSNRITKRDAEAVYQCLHSVYSVQEENIEKWRKKSNGWQKKLEDAMGREETTRQSQRDLNSRVTDLTGRLEGSEAEVKDLEKQRDEARIKMSALVEEAETSSESMQRVRKELDDSYLKLYQEGNAAREVIKERDKLLQSRKAALAVKKERDGLLVEKGALERRVLELEQMRQGSGPVATDEGREEKDQLLRGDESLAADVVNLQWKLDIATASASQLDQERDRFSAERQTLEDSQVKLTLQVSSLEAKAVADSQSLTQAESDRDTAVRQKWRLQQQADANEEKLKALLESSRSDRETVVQSKAERDRAIQQVAELQGRMEESQAKHTSTVSAVRVTLEKAEASLAQAIADKERLVETKQELERKLAIPESEKQNSVQDMEDLQTARHISADVATASQATAARQASVLSSERYNLRSALDRVIMQRDKQRQKAVRLSTELQIARLARDDESNRRRVAEDELAASEGKVHQLRQTSRAACLRAEQAEKDIEALKVKSRELEHGLAARVQTPQRQLQQEQDCCAMSGGQHRQSGINQSSGSHRDAQVVAEQSHTGQATCMADEKIAQLQKDLKTVRALWAADLASKRNLETKLREAEAQGDYADRQRLGAELQAQVAEEQALLKQATIDDLNRRFNNTAQATLQADSSLVGSDEAGSTGLTEAAASHPHLTQLCQTLEAVTPATGAPPKLGSCTQERNAYLESSNALLAKENLSLAQNCNDLQRLYDNELVASRGRKALETNNLVLVEQIRCLAQTCEALQQKREAEIFAMEQQRADFEKRDSANVAKAQELKISEQHRAQLGADLSALRNTFRMQEQEIARLRKHGLQSERAVQGLAQREATLSHYSDHYKAQAESFARSNARFQEVNEANKRHAANLEGSVKQLQAELDVVRRLAVTPRIAEMNRGHQATGSERAKAPVTTACADREPPQLGDRSRTGHSKNQAAVPRDRTSLAFEVEMGVDTLLDAEILSAVEIGAGQMMDVTLEREAGERAAIIGIEAGRPGTGRHQGGRFSSPRMMISNASTASITSGQRHNRRGDTRSRSPIQRSSDGYPRSSGSIASAYSRYEAVPQSRTQHALTSGLGLPMEGPIASSSIASAFNWGEGSSRGS